MLVSVYTEQKTVSILSCTSGIIELLLYCCGQTKISSNLKLEAYVVCISGTRKCFNVSRIWTCYRYIQGMVQKGWSFSLQPYCEILHSSYLNHILDANEYYPVPAISRHTPKAQSTDFSILKAPYFLCNL